MRIVEQLPIELEPGLKVTDEQLRRLSGWLTTEVSDAFSSRQALERVWRDCLRRYEGVPKNPVRNTPVVNAPNIEITIGAIAADSVYAQASELIWSISPLVTARAGKSNPVTTEEAQALQDFINRVATSELGLRAAYDNATLDDVQLGTGIFYVPWIQMKKKTRTARIIDQGPRAFAIPIENFLVPGGSTADLEMARWCAVRFWLTYEELADRAQLANWNISNIAAAGNVDWVRMRRERVGHSEESVSRAGNIYEIYDVYCTYDIDEDGDCEDLLVTWDRTSGSILKVDYNPFDRRPFAVMRYQLRAHMFYGLGVLEMLGPYQEEITELHNHRTLNSLLANTRMWKGKEGVVQENMRILPGKVILLDDPLSLQGEQLAEVYPSAAEAESITISLAERRVGLNDPFAGRPGSVLGSRTPGITTLSLLQQSSRRFTHSFDSIRLGTADAVIQALYRYQERLLAGDRQVEEHIVTLLGEGPGQTVIGVLRKADFDNNVEIELTAASGTTNREADRQNAIMLINVLAQYYQRTLELVMLASQPTTPPPVREVAGKIAKAVGEVIERTIRTFDSIRDPETFIVRVEEEINGLEGLPTEGLGGLEQLFGALTQAAGPGGAAPTGGQPGVGPGAEG